MRLQLKSNASYRPFFSIHFKDGHLSFDIKGVKEQVTYSFRTSVHRPHNIDVYDILHYYCLATFFSFFLTTYDFLRGCETKRKQIWRGCAIFCAFSIKYPPLFFKERFNVVFEVSSFKAKTKRLSAIRFATRSGFWLEVDIGIIWY